MRKKVARVFLITLMLVSVLAGVVAAAAYEVSLGHGAAADSLYQYGAEQFKKVVEEKTDGDVIVNIYPGGQIGHDRDLTEGIQLGIIEMGLIGTEPLTTFSPKMAVINLPFIFRNREVAYAILDGEIGNEIIAPLEKQGIINLAWMENGFRNITNSVRTIDSPADLKGLKIRTPNSPVSLAIFKALQANPTPMNFGEVYTALQQGTIDGQENPLALIYTSKFYEVNKHISLTGHIYSPCVLLISKQFFTSLPADYQEIVKKAAIVARDRQRAESMRREQTYVDRLKAAGAVINENPQLDLFIEATSNVWREFADQFGEEIYLKIKSFEPDS